MRPYPKDFTSEIEHGGCVSDKLRKADNHCLFRGEKMFNLNRLDKEIKKRKKRKGLDKAKI